jgi:arylsulfatase A-like enzyme
LKKELSPHARGFQKSFTYLAGAGSHYNHEPQLTTDIPRLPSLIGTGLWMADDKMLDRETDLPHDFYSSRTFTDRMLDFLSERNDEDKKKPFLACLTYTAPHWPLQAPKETIAKYKGKYDGGPEVLRQQRLAALKKLGIIGQDVVAAPVTGMGTAPWEELSAEEKAKSSRAMEIFAAMVDEMDVQIGRVLDYLKETDELDETFVLFMSDNGAEGAILEAFPVLNGISMADVIERFMDNSLKNMGTKTSYVWYGPRCVCHLL